VRLTADGEDVALVFDDNSVQLLSRRYGWASRGHHLTSFTTIHDVVFMSERGFLYVIGTWDDSAADGAGGKDGGKRKTLFGTCLLDSRSGDLVLYYDLDPRGFDEAALSKDLLDFIRAQERIPDAQMSQEDWSQGLYDGSAEGGNFILQRISVPASQQTYCEGQDLTLEIRLAPKDPLKRLRPIYDVPGAVGQMPLRVELQVSDADGVGHAVPTDTVDLTEHNNDVVVRFPWRFHKSGDYTVEPSVFLGPAMRVLSLPGPVPVRPGNPFEYGPGLTESNAYLFVGHEEMLSHLAEDVRSMNVMVCGSRRQGKSSLLNMLLTRLRSIGSGDIVAVRVSFDEVLESDSPGRASVGVIRALLSELHRYEEYVRVFALPDPDTITNEHKAKAALANIGREINEAYGSSGRLVLLADEVNTFEHFSDTGQFISSMLNYNADFFRIIAFGLPGGYEVNTLNNSALPSLLLQRRFLRPLSDREITALATGPIQGRYDIDSDALTELIRRAAGRPFDAQVMLRKALEKNIGEGRSTLSAKDIIRAFHAHLVPAYQSYLLDALKAAQTADLEEMQDWEEELKADFWKGLRIINNLDSKRSPARKEIWKYGFLRGDTGEYLNLPPAMLAAWVGSKE
jgi:hypothetical protein